MSLSESIGELFLGVLRFLRIAPKEEEEAQELWVSAEHANCRCSLAPLHARILEEDNVSLTLGISTNYAETLQRHALDWKREAAGYYSWDIPPKKPKRRTCPYCGTKTKKRHNCPACGAPL